MFASNVLDHRASRTPEEIRIHKVGEPSGEVLALVWNHTDDLRKLFLCMWGKSSEAAAACAK